MATAGFQDFTPPNNTRYAPSSTVTIWFWAAGVALGDGTGTARNDVRVDGNVVATFTATGATTTITQISREFIYEVEGPVLFDIADPPSTTAFILKVTAESGWTPGTHTIEIDGDALLTDYNTTRTFEVPETNYVGDWEQVNRDRLIQQFKDKTLIQGWLDAYSAQIQDFEDATDQAIYNVDITNAVGKNLDRWGEIWNVPRNSRLDDWVSDAALAGTLTYRTAIQVEQEILTSRGTEQDILDVLWLLIGEDPATAEAEWDEAFPKAVLIRPRNFVVSGSYQQQDKVLAQLQRAAPAGTKLEFLWTQFEASDDDLFRFSKVADTTQNLVSYGTENGTLAGAAI